MPGPGDRAAGPPLLILDAFNLEGRVALVTGAARGLGQALALGLAEAGADIAALDRLEVEGTRGRVEGLGRRCHPLTADLTELDPDRATAIVERCETELGGLDVVVNNAGVLRRAPALEFSKEDWEATQAVNLGSAFFLGQAAARRWVAAGRGGKIVNMASVLSYQGGILVPAYTASKSGLAGLTRALANEWAPHGINVNAIAPGYFTTELTAEIRSDAERDQAMLARIPAGRWGDPTDLQGTVVYLSSDAAAYVHGAVVSVDGGWLAR